MRAILAPIQIDRVDELAAARWPNPLVTIDRESVADALLIMLNLPLALIGGVAGVFLAGGVLSVPFRRRWSS